MRKLPNHALERTVGHRRRLVALGATTLACLPADFGRFIAEETEKWGKVIRSANIKSD